MTRVMVVTLERPHMYFDVDGTLVRPFKSFEEESEATDTDFIIINNTMMKVNLKVIEDLKMCRTRGHTVVVWSQGGSSWACTVVQALNLEEFVDIVIAKPSWYVDDKTPGTILDDSRYYDGNF